MQVKSQVLCARRKIGQAGPVTCRIRSGRAGQQAFQNKPGRSSRAVLHSGPVKPGGFWWDPGQAARPGPMPSLSWTIMLSKAMSSVCCQRSLPDRCSEVIAIPSWQEYIHIPSSIYKKKQVIASPDFGDFLSLFFNNLSTNTVHLL